MKKNKTMAGLPLHCC